MHGSEESEQWIENIDRTHLVLVSGNWQVKNLAFHLGPGLHRDLIVPHCHSRFVIEIEKCIRPFTQGLKQRQ